MPAPTDIVITGTGLACHLGDSVDAALSILAAGAPVPFATWDGALAIKAKCHLVGLYTGDLSDEPLGIDRKASRFMGKASRMALRSCRSALAQAQLEGHRDLAIIFGSGAGDTATHIDIQMRQTAEGGPRRQQPTVIPRLMASTVSANLSNVLRNKGPSFSATNACATGATNMLLAAQLIRAGMCQVALAGGVEINDPHFFGGFDSMRAFNSQNNDDSSRASRPYAADRAGFIFGEGAGAVVLERRDHAEARGATILGTLVAAGMSSDGEGQMVTPSPDGARRAMLMALAQGGVSADQIGYVNTHGTSTPAGDVAEVEAVRAVFGRLVPYSSTKGYTGHTVSGAGVLEAIFTLAMLRDGWVAASVNAQPLDAALADYPPVLVPGPLDTTYALSNSFGFGGTNVSLLLQRP